jgi:hypothetical protein
MDRILALQGLASFAHDSEDANSNVSAGCSSESSGQGASSCSVHCFEEEQLDW